MRTIVKVAPALAAFLFLALGGCSNLDLAPSPLHRLSGGEGDREPYVREDETEREAGRWQRLEKAMKDWDTAGLACREYRVGAGDVISVEILSLKTPGEYETIEREVEADGYLNVPLAGRVKVADLTPAEVERQMDETYRGKFIRNPEVRVTVKDYLSAAVVVTGAVRTPGVHYLKHETSSLLEVLFDVGGLAGTAGDTLVLTRADGSTGAVEQAESGASGGEPAMPTDASTGVVFAAESPAPGGQPGLPADPVIAGGSASNDVAVAAAGQKRMEVDLKRLIDQGDVRLNLAVRPGDILSVPAREPEYIYVLGYVRGPGPVRKPADREIGTLNALAMVGGLSSQGRPQRSYIIRETREGNKVINLDLVQIARGERPDVTLQAGDTLVVGAGAMMKFLEIFRVGGSMTYTPALVP